MKKAKITQLLQQWTTKELNAFRKFLHSPYFNLRTDVIDLFEIIASCCQQAEELPAKTVIFSQIYPQENEYDDQNFRLLLSYLFRLAEQFIAIEEIMQDHFLLKLKTGRYYRNKNLSAFFAQNIKKIESSLDKKPFRNGAYFMNQTQVQIEKHHFTSTEQGNQDLNLQAISDSIDIAYLTQKLKHSCDLLAHQNISQSQYEIGFLTEVLSFIKQENLLTIPAINVYYHCYFMLKEPEMENHFQKFKPLLFQYGHHFSKTEVRDLYLAANNFCIRQLNQGKEHYFHETLDLYKEGLKKEYLLENGILSRLTYFNIAVSGLQTKDYEWTEFFIKKYKKHLEKKHRESSYSFNLARLEYARKHYTTVIDLLQKSNYRDLFVNLASKTLLLKVYFEMDEFNLLHSHLEAMKNYIRRKHIIGYHRKNYSNIVRYAQKLMTLNPFDNQEKAVLKQQVQEEEVLTERAWFLAQLSEG